MEILFGLLVSMFLQAATLLFVPVITFGAALRLRGCVPSWIPTTMLIASVCKFLASLPSVAMMAGPILDDFGGGIAPENLGMIFSMVGTVNMFASAAIAIAIFALAGRVRHTAMRLAQPQAS